jgi:5-deoxy-5-amino-3-dehydroquinate dehydratase
MTSHLLLLNGPNLGRLGTREPDVYGTTTLAEIEAAVAARAASYGLVLRAEQHDSQAALIDALRRHQDVAGLVLNPGAFMTYGYALAEALADFPAPWAEVHISNVWKREAFRHESVLAASARGVIAGLGADGYLLAVDALARRHPGHLVL